MNNDKAKNNDKVNVRQLGLFAVLFTVGSSILFIPSGSAAAAGPDGWIAILVGMAGSLGIIGLHMRLARQAPGRTLVEMNRKWLGKWLGPLCSFFFSVNAILLSAASLLFYLGDFIATQIMTDTPMTVIHLLFALVVVMGLRMGIGTMGRAAEVLFPVFAGLFAVMILLLAPDIQPHYLQPAFTSGAKGIARAAIDYMSFSGLPFIYFLMLYPSVDAKPSESAKALYIGSLAGGFFLLAITVVCIAVLGVENTVQHSFPSYALARKINIGNVLTRIEVIMATLWIISLYFKLVLYFYAGLKGMAQLLKIGDERQLVLPFGVLLVLFSLLMYPDKAYQSWWDSEIWPIYAATLGLLFPLVLLALAKLRGGGDDPG